MNNAMKVCVVTLLAGLACIVVGGCAKQSVSGPAKTNNPAVPVETLFVDPDGNTVRRFYDDGHYHYYVVGPKTATVSATQPQNKSSRVEAIPTVTP